MKSVKEIVREFKIFERSKVPVEVKRDCDVHLASTRRTAKILSEIHPVSKSSVLDKEARRKVAKTEKKPRNSIAIDETVVKANKKCYYVFSAVVERNELILMRVYTTRNFLTAKSFVKE